MDWPGKLLRLLPALLVTAAIFASASLPGKYQPNFLRGGVDKYAHAVAYGLDGTLQLFDGSTGTRLQALGLGYCKVAGANCEPGVLVEGPCDSRGRAARGAFHLLELNIQCLEYCTGGALYSRISHRHDAAQEERILLGH